MGTASEGELTKRPRAWSSLADSRAQFSTVSESPSGLDASFGMAILRQGRSSATKGKSFVLSLAGLTLSGGLVGFSGC